MRRWLIAALFLAGSACFAQSAYKPLTLEEALLYVQKASPEAVAEDVMRLDAIEHATPVVKIPDAVIGVTNRDVFVSWAASDKGSDKQAVVEVTIADDLYFQFELPAVSGEGLVPDKTAQLVLVGTVSGISGAVLVIIIDFLFQRK